MRFSRNLRGVRRLSALAVVFVFVVPAASSPADGTSACAVPARPSLCKEFAVFERRAQPSDRLPESVRHLPPFRHVDRSSARRIGDRPKGWAWYIVGGRKQLCVIGYDRRHGDSGGTCSRPNAVIRGQMYLTMSCDPGRPHRMLVAQLVPDGPHRAVIRRVHRPRLVVAIRHNLLVADLPVRSHAQLPTSITWHRRGRLRQVKIPPDDMDVTCRAPS